MARLPTTRPEPASDQGGIQPVSTILDSSAQRYMFTSCRGCRMALKVGNRPGERVSQYLVCYCFLNQLASNLCKYMPTVRTGSLILNRCMINSMTAARQLAFARNVISRLLYDDLSHCPICPNSVEAVDAEPDSRSGWPQCGHVSGGGVNNTSDFACHIVCQPHCGQRISMGGGLIGMCAPVFMKEKALHPTWPHSRLRRLWRLRSVGGFFPCWRCHCATGLGSSGCHLSSFRQTSCRCFQGCCRWQ